MAENGNSNGNNGLNLEGLATIAGSVKNVALLNLAKQIRAGKKLTAHDLELLNEIEKESSEQQKPQLDKESVHSSDRYFKIPSEVLYYLQDEGWKVKKSKFYEDINKKAKLQPDASGNFTLKAVLGYAKTHLPRKDTLQKVKAEELQRKKAAKELEKLDEEIKEKRLKRKIAEGKYILKEEVYFELAARAAVLETDFKGMIQMRGPEFVGLVHGDEKKTGDLIREMMAEVDRVLNGFATTKGFQVVFEDTKDADTESA